jgi:hypothetical protein
MDYDMTRLGDRQFEHVAQALLVKYVGPHAQVFGAGKDGGREATWHGQAADPLRLGWDGYCVAQAKYMYKPRSPAENADWLKSQIRAELDEWSREESKREPLPEYFLIITNVVLSAVPGAGVDSVLSYIDKQSRSRGITFRGYDVWHYDKLRVLIDDSDDIRRAYAAWITPGDVLAALIEAKSTAAAELSAALVAHTAKCMVDDRRLNLTQAGSVGDEQVGISDVFIDVPAFPPDRTEAMCEVVEIDGLERPAISGIARELVTVCDNVLSSAAVSADSALQRAARSVLIGGPGQGKSTIGQYLCQLYRAAFLEGATALAVADVRLAREGILAHATRIQLSLPKARRWPVRIVLSELADALSLGTCRSLIHYVAQQLSRRSGAEVAVAHVREWLRQYPWLVVLDGLDEVPGLSSRARVMQAISDFQIDAHTLEGDVFVVATSRPQNYNGEFAKEQCRHYELAPLPKDVALAYGRSLIDVRLGVGSDRALAIRRRLDRATSDEATAKLLETPLQVTILTLLLERLGHAPRDRWRLFHQYYRVIYQREQEKGGELAELLQSHEPDVHFVHRRIALLLQKRSEHSGDASATLPIDEFRAVIADRLKTQGHSEGDAVALAEKIVSLSTDRLVFLAAVQENQIGFEIRSLQEFMAAEGILTGGDGNAIRGLRTIAISKYWRNVLLFAIGRIFAVDQHLRAEVTNLCMETNADTVAFQAVLPGSRLAVDILLERVTLSQPAFSRILAQCVARLLHLPYGTLNSLGLHQLVGVPEAWSLIKDEVRSHCRAADAGALTGIRLLAATADAGETSAEQDLEHCFATLPEDQRLALIRDPDSYGSMSLIKVMKPWLSHLNLMDCLAISNGRLTQPDRLKDFINRDPNLLPPALAAAIILRDLTGHRHTEMEEVAPSVHLSIVPVDAGATNDLLKAIASAPLWEQEHLPLYRICQFVLEPSAAKLALALQGIAGADLKLTNISYMLPWPLASCIYARFPPCNVDLTQLADAATSGELGDIDDWRTAESRWRESGFGLDISPYNPVKIDGERPIQLPYGADIAQRGFPASLLVSVSQPTTRAQYKKFREWCVGLRQILEISDSSSLHSVRIADLILFIAEVVDEGRKDRGSRSRRLPGIPRLLPLVDLFATQRINGYTTNKLPRSAVMEALNCGREYIPELLRIGRLAGSSFPFSGSRNDERILEVCIRLWRDDQTLWPLIRLALDTQPFSFDATLIPPAIPPNPDETAAGIYRLLEAIRLSAVGTEDQVEKWVNRLDPQLFQGSLDQVFGIRFPRAARWFTMASEDERYRKNLSLPARMALATNGNREPGALYLVEEINRELASSLVGDTLPELD